MYDIIIIGCGIIGASIAYKLSKFNLKVLVLERENDVAMGTTKANSAIVHAGYDPEPETMMAKLNLEGSKQMEKLCQSLDVLYRRIGSMVLAFDEQEMKTLHVLYEKGVKNGVPDMRILSGDEARKLEPALSEDVCGALLAPSAAIVDPWGLCIAQAEAAVKNGVRLQRNCCVSGLVQQDGSLKVHTDCGDFEGRFVINCAGTAGHEISGMLGEPEWEARPVRGEYYLLDKECGSLVDHVIFQCPSKKGKGVLIAPTVHGNLIVGPTADRITDAEDKATTSKGLEQVAKDSRKSIPSINLGMSIRNFCGVRAVTS